ARASRWRDRSRPLSGARSRGSCCGNCATARLERVVLGVLDRIAEAVEPFLEIIGKQRHAEEIFVGAVSALGACRGDGLVELLGSERAAPDPGERHQTRLLVLVQVADELLELGLGRIV